MSAPLPLRERLRAIAPAQAKLQTTIIAALNGRMLGSIRTTARLASIRERRAASGWILFETRSGPVAVAPLLADGNLAHITGDQGRLDGPLAAATLGSVEPLLAAIETILGLDLRPDGLAREIDPTRLMLRLDALDPGGPIRHRLLVALPNDLDVDPPPLGALLPVTLGQVKLRWTGAIAGPSLSPSRLARAAQGDLLLLGAGALVARLALPGRARKPGARLDLNAGQLTLEPDDREHDVSNRVDSPQDTEGTSSASLAEIELAEVRVPTRIEFDGGSVAAASLATLAPGSVLPVPVAGGVLNVRVVAGDTLWAEGELVAVGDGYGVLIGAIRGHVDSNVGEV